MYILHPKGRLLVLQNWDHDQICFLVSSLSRLSRFLTPHSASALHDQRVSEGLFRVNSCTPTDSCTASKTACLFAEEVVELTDSTQVFLAGTSWPNNRQFRKAKYSIKYFTVFQPTPTVHTMHFEINVHCWLRERKQGWVEKVHNILETMSVQLWGFLLDLRIDSGYCFKEVSVGYQQ